MSQRSNLEPPAGGARIRLGVSACLLGERVRYDGGDKRESFVADVLPRYFELVPLCPEVAIGLGMPREPIRLEGDVAAPRVIGVNTKSLDVTEPLAAYGRDVAARLADISGYVFKSKSPSCGLEQVKVFGADGAVRETGRGVYAAALLHALPLLPAEEEGRLRDPALRENFIERVYAYHRWQRLLAAGVSAERLVDFHAVHKLIIMAHSRRHLTALGRLVAEAGSRPPAELAERYGQLFMEALACLATRKRHADVLYHLMSYLKRALAPADKAELVATIERYRTGQLPLSVPVALLRDQFRRHPHPYVERQAYLDWPPTVP